MPRTSASHVEISIGRSGRTSAGPPGSPTAFTYDKADRITAAGSTSYTVNANGNLTARGSTDSFAYDQANRLTTVTIGTTASGSYGYDGDGNRIGRSWAASGSSGNAAYVHDVNRGLPTVIDDGTNKYVWTIGLAYSVNKSTGVVTTYHHDGLGSVRALTNARAEALLLLDGARRSPFVLVP